MTTGRRKFRLWLGVGIIVLAMAMVFFPWNRSQTEKALRTAPIVRVERGDIDIKLMATGTVTPHTRVVIRPPMPGRVESILVAEGDSILRGNVVGTFSSAERVLLLDAAAARGPEELRKWDDIIKPIRLVAPASGTVIIRNAEPGRTVTVETDLLTISDRLIVRAQLHEDDVAKIAPGQRAEVTVDAIPGLVVIGAVEKIASDARLASNIHTYETDLTVPKLPAKVRSGMGVNITFTLAQRSNILLLPLSAIHEADGMATVQLVDDNGAAGARHTVELGLRDGQRVEIVSGLDEGQAVVDSSVDGAPAERKVKSPLLNPYNKK
jgi:macrolide-specific efflux system membrane fusion protein